MEVLQYIDRTGRNRFERWFDELPDEAKPRIVSSLERLRRGNTSAMKGVGSGVFEIRLDFGPGYRVYCGRDGDALVILLGGGTKKRQQTDIWHAQSLWQEYKLSKQEKT